MSVEKKCEYLQDNKDNFRVKNICTKEPDFISETAFLGSCRYQKQFGEWGAIIYCIRPKLNDHKE